jgi:two-component system phosphate regulon sensor histidine kinase PhoR
VRILGIVRLTRRAVVAIVTAVVVSLAGSVAVQLILLSNARQLKEQAFRGNAINAMQTVARQLETREAALQVVRLGGFRAGGRAIRVTSVAMEDSALENIRLESDGMSRLVADHNPVWIDNGVLHYRVTERGRITIEARDSITGKSTTLVDSDTIPGSYQLKLDDSLAAACNLLIRVGHIDSASLGDELSWIDRSGQGLPTLDSNRMLIVSQVLDNLITGETAPVEQRLDTLALDSLLSVSFTGAGIDLGFQYAVVSTDDGSVRVASAGLDRSTVATSDLRTRLFPNDLFSTPTELVVIFPDRASFVTRELLPLAAASTAFMLVIALCFAYSIITIMRQRRFAQLTVDFINNMTHEFKTPLSTVALACEALARPEVAADSGQVRRYESMIRDEYARMRSNVDKILQMAVLEEGDYELTISDVDFHAVIDSAVRGIALQVENRGGRLELHLDASSSHVAADPMHLSNVVANLLDNAVKYSTDSPHITVTTRNEGRQVILEIADRGIGIAPRDLPHLFDKYYRVRTGDVHDVKGFGIGLSYVKLMTEAMGGRIAIASEPGKGTAATLNIPIEG